MPAVSSCLVNLICIDRVVSSICITYFFAIKWTAWIFQPVYILSTSMPNLQGSPWSYSGRFSWNILLSLLYQTMLHHDCTIAAFNFLGECQTQIPFVIMTSDDTHDRTLELLESNSYFGMQSTQVKLLKQVGFSMS